MTGTFFGKCHIAWCNVALMGAKKGAFVPSASFLRKLKNENGGAKKQGQQEVGLGKAVKKSGGAKPDKAAKEVPKAKAERKHKLTLEEMIESGKGRPEEILVMCHVNNSEKKKQPGNATPQKSARKKKSKGEQGEK